MVRHGPCRAGVVSSQPPVIWPPNVLVHAVYGQSTSKRPRSEPQTYLSSSNMPATRSAYMPPRSRKGAGERGTGRESVKGACAPTRKQACAAGCSCPKQLEAPCGPSQSGGDTEHLPENTGRQGHPQCFESRSRNESGRSPCST